MENEYNLYCDDEFVGTYTTTELAERFNVSTQMIRNNAVTGKSKYRYKKHYSWHKIYQATKKPLSKKTKELMEEWDRVTEPYRNRHKTA